MDDKWDQGTAAINERLPVVVPAGEPPDVLRCTVCERPLLRRRSDKIQRFLMIKCRACGTLQHRHL